MVLGSRFETEPSSKFGTIRAVVEAPIQEPRTRNLER
jgi:hypothetical protein